MIIVNRKSFPHTTFFVSDETLHSPGGHAWRLTTRPHVWRPATDVYEMQDRFLVRIEIAGMRQADFNISMEQSTLTISGVRPDEPERKAYHQMEIPFGEFYTEIEFPATPIQLDAIEAEYQDGFLRITLPKARPTQIKIPKE